MSIFTPPNSNRIKAPEQHAPAEVNEVDGIYDHVTGKGFENLAKAMAYFPVTQTVERPEPQPVVVAAEPPRNYDNPLLAGLREEIDRTFENA